MSIAIVNRQDVGVWNNSGVRLSVTMTPNISGGILTWSMAFTLRHLLSTAVLITKTVGSGITIDTAQSFYVDLSASDVASLAGNYYYDIWRTDGSFPGPIVTNSRISFAESVKNGILS